MLRKIFGHYVTFIVWHAYVGGGVAFLMAAITQGVHWQSWIMPVPAFWTVFAIGCLVGWFHHDKSKEIKKILPILILFLFCAGIQANPVYTVINQDECLDGSINLMVIYNDKVHEKETVIVRLSAADALDNNKVSAAVDARISEWKKARIKNPKPVETPRIITR